MERGKKEKPKKKKDDNNRKKRGKKGEKKERTSTTALNSFASEKVPDKACELRVTARLMDFLGRAAATHSPRPCLATGLGELQMWQPFAGLIPKVRCHASERVVGARFVSWIHASVRGGSSLSFPAIGRLVGFRRSV